MKKKSVKKKKVDWAKYLLVYLLAVVVVAAVVTHETIQQSPRTLTRAPGATAVSSQKVPVCGDLHCQYPETKDSCPNDCLGYSAFSYYDEDNEALKYVREVYSTNGNVDRSIPKTLVDGLHNSFTGFYNDIAIGENGFPVIAYYDYSKGAGNLNIGFCSDVDCRQFNHRALDSKLNNPHTGRHVSIAINNAGNPIISYEGVSVYGQGELKGIFCKDPYCSDFVKKDFEIAGVGNGAITSSIIAGVYNNPMIAYSIDQYGDINDNLKVIFCSDNLCSTELVNSLTTGGSTGYEPSIVMTSDLKPVILHKKKSYSGVSFNWILNVVKCTDTICSSGNEREYDSSVKLDRKSELLLRADGVPVFTYISFDTALTNPDSLKFGSCIDNKCN